MSQLRKTYTVQWDDREPVTVTTNAMDMTKAADHQGNDAMLTFALVHAAVERHGHNPPPLEEFINVLDDIRLHQAAGGEGEEVPPTSAGPGGGVLLRSPSSPAPTGGPGSTTSEPS